MGTALFLRVSMNAVKTLVGKERVPWPGALESRIATRVCRLAISTQALPTERNGELMEPALSGPASLFGAA